MIYLTYTSKLNLNSISVNIQEYWISANILSGNPSCQLFIYEDKEFEKLL